VQPTRRARLEARIQEELSVIVPRAVKDPRVPPVTFTSVTLTDDASQATVFVALFGEAVPTEPGEEPKDPDPQKVKECLAGLQSAAGFLRRHLASELTVRHIPALIFREDRGFRNASRVQELLSQLERQEGKK
jgi:ribosome-binding factor A